MISRNNLARYIAAHLETERPALIRAAASWLVAHKRRREARYLVRDVERELASRGYVVAAVTTAHPMTTPTEEALVASLKQSSQAEQVELTTTVEPSLIGGMIVTTPTKHWDTSVRHRLDRLMQGVTR